MSDGPAYIPISCNFYDELEALATLRKPAQVVFSTNGATTSLKGIIKDLYVRQKVEYLKMDSGLEIRLDQLIEVDGKIPSNYC